MSGYDQIGQGYTTTRRPDLRIAAALHAALAGMESVINVGAGTGSYEPAQTTAAVEPSAVMIAQRPPGSAPAVQARAEAVPLVDDASDAAMAVLTVHHWDNVEAGIAELRRIARRRIVIFTFDPLMTAQYWLVREYLPQLPTTDPLDRLVAALDEDCSSVTPVPIPHDCTDGFAAAFWRRPAAHLDPAVRAGMSVFATADPDVVAAGLDHLARDLDSGAWQARHADLLGVGELDVGYRLVVTDLTAT